MLKDRLKELRKKQGLTQEEVARELCVSAQSVSKWERGLVSPDISLLPRIALLFGCSLDSLFEMEEHQKLRQRDNFREQLRSLKEKKDHDGVFEAYANEIRRRPDAYSLYVDWMRSTYQNKLLSDSYLLRIFSLTEYALSHCQDPDQRNEIFKWLLTLSAGSQTPAIREKGKELYGKIPSIRHSREIFAKFVFEEEEALLQIRKNVLRCIDMAECAIRQLVRQDMPTEEKLYYYKKALSLYEVLLQDGFGGFWDPPYAVDCAIVSALLAEAGRLSEARVYLEKVLAAFERHLHPAQCILPPLLEGTVPPSPTPYEETCRDLLRKLVKDPRMAVFHEEILTLAKRYYRHFGFDPKLLTK